MKFDVIVLPIIEWDHRFQRPQHLASAFADDGHRVYYTRLTFGGWDAPWSMERARDNLWRVSLPGPADHNRFLQPLPGAAVDRCVEALLDLARAEGIAEAVIMVQQPFWAETALRLAERTGWKLIYDCMDEHDGLTALNQDIVAAENTLSRRSDLVVSTSRKLAQKHSALARRHVMLPNACEFEHFAQPGPGPDPLADLPGPIIGYYGAIMDWFDVDMIANAAERRPDWSFVLIGAIDIEDAERLRAMRNVRLLGEKPYHELPAYLHRFDVALIPFKLVPIIQATNPVKFYEYLSAGKPVVSTALPELEPFPDLYSLAHDGASLVAQAEAAMAQDSQEQADARRSWASGQTWKARYAVLRQEIDHAWGKAGIVIVSYQNLDRIRECVESIVAHTDYPDYEVVIVDNASSPEVVLFLQDFCASHPRFRLIVSDDNLGFAKGNNLGVSVLGSDCEYVVLLNNDTVVTDGWLAGLTRRLHDPTIGIVGPVTWPNGTANEAAVPVDYTDMAGMHAFAAEWSSRHRGEAFDLPMLAFYCVAMRRGDLDRIGSLDEAFGIGMFEDDDYAMRVRGAGLRVVCARDVFIHHVGRSSFGRLEDARYNALFEANKAHYEAKWGVAWRRPSTRPDVPALLGPHAVKPLELQLPTARSVSVVLVNYNGREHLDACLESLARLDYPTHLLEVVLVDNASSDGSVDWLRARCPDVRLIENVHNVGFSRACNQGVAAARGEYIAFLNNDMRVDPQWLNGLLAAMGKDASIACAGSMVMNWEGTAVEYAGRFDDVFSIAYEPLPQQLRPQYAANSYSLFVSGGAMLLERTEFLEAGGFDERYFMYHEDVDLCWRLWTRGRRCCLAPESIVYHRGGASSSKLQSDVVQGWGQKHLLWTITKNLDDRNLREALPLLVYFLCERGRWLDSSIRALAAAFEETQAALSSILSSRRTIQDGRKTADADIFAITGHPFAFVLRSPLMQAMRRELEARIPAAAVNFADPGAVAAAMCAWLRESITLRSEFANAWHADAGEKYRRVHALSSPQPQVPPPPVPEGRMVVDAPPARPRHRQRFLSILRRLRAAFRPVP